jgi:ribonuclease-3
MSRAEIRDGGNERDSTLEDAIEAIVGAIYLDSGMQATRKTVLSWYGDMEETLSAAMEDYNPKGRLQEIAQALHGPDQIRYLIDREEGPSHRKRYSVSVEVAERKLGSGFGRSKKEAEEEAARKALQSISRKRKKTNKRASGPRQKNESTK